MKSFKFFFGDILREGQFMQSCLLELLGHWFMMKSDLGVDLPDLGVDLPRLVFALFVN